MTPWQVMWIISYGIFVSFKLLTYISAKKKAPLSRQLAYLFLWTGLGPDAFLGRRRVDPPLGSEWREAAASLLAGFAVYVFATRIFLSTESIFRGFLIIAGLVLMFHFGFSGLLSCFWRRAGIDAKPLMNSPQLAISLTEFWGKRWNTAFRDFAHAFCFLPVHARFGPAAAIWATYLFSGVIHDVVLSIPAGSGYGLPTLYFLIQGLGTVLERRMNLAKRGMLLRRAVTLAWVVLPAGLLFHGGFIRTVILPTFPPPGEWSLPFGKDFLILAGAALHLPVIVAALLVPSQLAWKRELAPLGALHRQMHWLYGAHIFLCLAVFSLLSFFHTTELSSGTPLARSLCGFIALFWSIRLCAQFFLETKPYLDSAVKRLGYELLSYNFAALVAVYIFAAAV